jgi:5-methyltetrahydrofolate--homocysteine methyltransferase
VAEGHTLQIEIDEKLLRLYSLPYQRRVQFKNLLKDKIIIFDGAMGTSVQKYDLSAADFGGKEGCNDYLVLTKPSVIEEIHASFLEAGADVLETCTFGSNRLKLDEYGIGSLTYDVNFAAAQLARKVAAKYSTSQKPRFVAGSMGPTGMLPSSEDPALSNITYDQLSELFYEQAKALTEGGCDALLVETGQDILEMKAAVDGINRYFQESARRILLMTQVTLDVSGRMLLGTDIRAAMTTLECLPIDVFGMNCSTGPQHMKDSVRYLGENSRRFLSCIPNAGLPINEGNVARYPLQPEEMAATLREFVLECGVNIVGGCCGTTPEHIRRLSDAVGDLKPKIRSCEKEEYVSSGMTSFALHQYPKPMIVGERVNSQGSRKAKQFLIDDDYDSILMIGREQVEGGAHVLDVCVAMNEREDEAEQMKKVVKKLSLGVEAPLVIDSTEAAVIELALKNLPGRGIINSINMENGRKRIDAVCPIAKRHGAALVALTIDEEGMAKTIDRKVAVARRIHEIVTREYGIRPELLIFDALTFTLATGEKEFLNSGIETIEGIRRIKEELPGVMTILGVSNVSFGLSPQARHVLNSVFLYHCLQAGLDLAIVNPKDIIPYPVLSGEPKQLAEELVFNKHPEALKSFIEYFETHSVENKKGEVQKENLDSLGVEERIHYQILNRLKDGIEAQLDEAMKKYSPVEVLNEILLPAMKDVGDRFGRGELILPFVLQSAEVMKKAVAHLEQFLEKHDSYTKGKVVLATVYGDVHDIGKNLVNTILSNNGYTVFDLGKQVPLTRILDKAKEVNADAIGLSALLVSTSKQMGICVHELHKMGLHYPLIIGGAAINRDFGRRIMFVDEEQLYDPGVFYAKDAFEGLAIMDQLIDTGKRNPFLERIRTEAHLVHKRKDEKIPSEAPSTVRSAVRSDVPIPRAPFLGVKELHDIPLKTVFRYIDTRSLFRMSWGGKTQHDADWDRIMREEFQPRFQEVKLEALKQHYMQPRVLYAYFNCNSSGNDLIIYHPKEEKKEVSRFIFPRQVDKELLCLSDYYAPIESGKVDVVAFQIVTVGSRILDLIAKWNENGDVTRAYYYHGFAVEVAEALAEYAHRHIRKELKLKINQGKRYSWGYPACPDLSDHQKVFRLLPGEQIGLSLTSAFQLVPEASTAAIVAHHPDAKYFFM